MPVLYYVLKLTTAGRILKETCRASSTYCSWTKSLVDRHRNECCIVCLQSVLRSNYGSRSNYGGPQHGCEAHKKPASQRACRASGAEKMNAVSAVDFSAPCVACRGHDLSHLTRLEVTGRRAGGCLVFVHRKRERGNYIGERRRVVA